MPPAAKRIRVLYLAPWVDVGGSDKGTIDWFRFLDRDRFRPSLITTQPSDNRRLAEITPFAEEVWELPELMRGDDFARFILTFIHTRQVQVVHVMNSRLAFELLPDIVQLPARPRVVVQLHVEEADRSGYVRYVTTRYGNLVDAFSVSSQALSDALDAYDVPVTKRRLIRTGVDAEREFSPAHVRPLAGLDDDACQIIYPARLEDQKDPWLMVEVARRLRDHGLRFRLHVLGDGRLEPGARARVDRARLHDEVIFHGTSMDMAPWYAACDLVLLTSLWEGLPYVIYEAMAMAKPVVAADLPGIRELLSPGAGVLISPRGDAEAYASAIAGLASDPARRTRLGFAARERARSELSIERMAAEHASLYEELLAAGPASALRSRPRLAAQPSSPALRARRPGSSPLVSVIVPCFNHGRYLSPCLRSIADQMYCLTETIVVDDGSTDPETIETLAGIEREASATVVRMPVNRGPSAARNVALERAHGRYVLPLDADNLLLPGALAALVKQLSSAGERIGFIYPTSQFFGNRTDCFEPPSYNVNALLSFNYCDTGSLIDREVFDRGFRYAEDVGLGHEDWDFVLSLAEHGIYGEPARAKTLLYRKHGFTRSDLVDAGNISFASVIADRHAGLFAAGANLKAHWSPAVSVIALDALPSRAHRGLEDLVHAASHQTCQDFELIVYSAADVWPTELGGRLRRLPSALAASRAQALAHGLGVARGRYALATYGSPAALLDDPPQIERVLQALWANASVEALALADANPSLPPFRLLDADAVGSAPLGSLCWTATGTAAPPESLVLPASSPLETLARWLSATATVQWRHVPRRDRRAIASSPSAGSGLAAKGPAAAIGAPRCERERDARIRTETPPRLPKLPAGVAHRVSSLAVWMPPQARLLCRHLHHRTGRYVFSNDTTPPPGCSLHYHLGCLRVLPLPGTRSLRGGNDLDDSEFTLGENVAFDELGVLGFVEQAPLPLFDPLQLGRHFETGQPVLIAGPEDPLAASVADPHSIGYIEPYPIHPRRVRQVDVHYGLRGIVRALDTDARRHRYAAGRVPEGQLAGELGALLSEPVGDCEPLWIDRDGRVLTGAQWSLRNGRPPVRTTIRWAGAPLAWRGFSTPTPRMRATARRTLDAARFLAAGRSAPPTAFGDPAGYLMRSQRGSSLPLYLANHPVTGDQLLSTDRTEAGRLGYEHATLLGYLAAHAPVTGTLGLVRPGIPWASRFGLAAAGR